MKKAPNAGKSWSKKDVKSIETKAKSGESTKDIAKDLGRTEDAVRNKASDESISLKPKD